MSVPKGCSPCFLLAPAGSPMTTLTSLSSQPRIPNGFSILLRGVICLGFRVMGSLPQQWRSRWTRTSKMTQQLYETTIWSKVCGCGGFSMFQGDYKGILECTGSSVFWNIKCVLGNVRSDCFFQAVCMTYDKHATLVCLLRQGAYQCCPLFCLSPGILP